LTQTSVYPREVVKAALKHNAAAVILAHNHPSGIAEPSRADELLTQALKQALGLIDCRVLDHVIVAGATIMGDGRVVLILDVADKTEAEAFWAGEPFNRAGVYDWTIERWRFGHV
jgi:uncharacterized protein YciI